MAKKFLSGFERENIKEALALTESYECMQCSEPITNPICHDCLGRQIKAWMNLYPSVRKKMSGKISNYVIEVNNNTINSVNCISCGKNKAALCPYCFTEAVYNLLKKNKIDKMVLMDFLSTFNFDMKHEGYIQEAAEEGLY